MVQERIERDVVIAASPERVWDIITRAEHVGIWFSDAAEVDLRPGGTITFRWDKHGTQIATIEKVEAPRYFSYRWSPGTTDASPAADTSTLVEFTLTPVDGQTRVRVVETGFERLALDDARRAEQFDDNSNGWSMQMRDLKAYIDGLAA